MSAKFLTYKVIGLEDINFVNRDGVQIQGKKIYLVQDIPESRGIGAKAEGYFLSSTALATLEHVPAVGDVVELLFSRRGRLASIRLVDVMLDLDI